MFETAQSYAYLFIKLKQELMALDAEKKKRLSIHVVSMAEGGAGRKVNEVDAEIPPPTTEKVSRGDQVTGLSMNGELIGVINFFRRKLWTLPTGSDNEDCIPVENHSCPFLVRVGPADPNPSYNAIITYVRTFKFFMQCAFYAH